MEPWRKCWREGIVPSLSDKALAALAEGLRANDPRILQGATTEPPPLEVACGWPVVAACPLTFAGWQGEGKETIEAAQDYFARVCYETDQRLGGTASCRYFLCWVDEAPREEMVRLLLEEVEREQAKRRDAA